MMFMKKCGCVIGGAILSAVVAFSILSFVGVSNVQDVKASVMEKLTTIYIYQSQESKDASTISTFNNGGTPGLILSSSKVVIGDSLYVGSSESDSVRVLTEDDLESIKKELYDQVYAELKEKGCSE